MFSRKKKCGVCGYRVTPTKEAIYTAEEPRSFAEALTKKPTRFDAIDCPRCGCQIPLAIRADRLYGQKKEETEVAADENKEHCGDMQEE